MGRWSKERHAQEAAKKAKPAKAGVSVSESVPGTTTEDNPTPVVPTPEKNPRNAYLESLASREEPQDTVEAKAEDTVSPDTITGASDTVSGAQDTVAGAQDTIHGAVEAKTVKVKIDGEEFEVSQSEIDEAGGVVAYRTAKAGEKRLKEARETLAEAKRLRDEMAAIADKKPKEPVQTDEQFIASKMEAVRFGTEAEAAAALKEILSRANTPVNQDQVTNRTLIQVRRQAAIDRFGEEFNDIVSNPVLARLALTLEREEVAKLPQNADLDPAFVGKFDWNHFYRSIGNQIRGAIGRPSQTTSPTVTTTGQPSPSSAKEERKASAVVTLPQAASKAKLPEEEKEPTREDVLAEMRKTRGQIG